MHAWLCENPIGIDAVTWQELPTPVPAEGQVLINIKAASLNFPDILIVQNKYQHKPALPFVPGSEYAGVIEAVGPGVTHLKVGQNVACLSGTGGFGTHTLAPAAMCMPLPNGFSHVDAAAFIMIYATSYHALVDRAQLKAGETVLILGAAGGVGRSHQLQHPRPARKHQNPHWWQRPRRDLRPRRRPLHRARLPQHRLARSLFGGRFCSGAYSRAAVQPHATQRRIGGRRILG
jgi:D-arabinose 1-dehydrogenase-like Zn-dependent alcohol dehydrogenase